MLSETKLTQTVKQLRQAQAEIESLESDITKLIRAIEEMKDEQRYLQEMRGMPVEDEEDYESEDEQFIRRIAEDPEDAAGYYRKLADETRKEFKFIQEQFTKVTQEDTSAAKTEELAKASRQTQLVMCLSMRARDVLLARLDAVSKQVAQLKNQNESSIFEHSQAMSACQ